MKRIVLDYDDLDKLVQGKVLEKDDVKIILSDLGWYNMMEIIIKNHVKLMGNSVVFLARNYILENITKN